MVLPNNKALETIYVSGLRILNDQPQQASLQQAFWNSFSSPISPTFTSITFDSTFESLSFLIWLIQNFQPQTLTLTMKNILVNLMNVTRTNWAVPLPSIVLHFFARQCTSQSWLKLMVKFTAGILADLYLMNLMKTNWNVPQPPCIWQFLTSHCTYQTWNQRESCLPYLQWL